LAKLDPALRQLRCPVSFVPGGHLVLDLSESACYAIFRYGRQPHTGAEEAFFARAIRATDCVLDVGGNIGYTALLFATLAARGHVHVFEPAPRALRLLRATVEGLANVTVHSCAVSDVDGTVQFSQQPMLDLSYVANGSEKRGLTVPAVSLDSIVANRGLQPDFLKVDVEGHEQQVFRGAPATLRRYRPLILFEALDSSSLEMTALEIRRAVPQYTFHSVHPGGALRPLPSISAIPQ